MFHGEPIKSSNVCELLSFPYSNFLNRFCLIQQVIIIRATEMKIRDLPEENYMCNFPH